MLPVRHTPGLFSLDISSISLKDVRQQMEFPFFSLSKRPDLGTRRWEDRQGNSLEITPSVLGLPTIYDKDLLIYAVSLIMDALNRGEPASRRLRMYASDALEFANRAKGGREYRLLEDAFRRLRGCTITTNIRPETMCRRRSSALLTAAASAQYGFDGRLQYVDLTLSEWLWSAIKARQVLTLHPDYFRLRQPLERRIYEIARKFCGRQAEWRISLAQLHHKSGSRSDLRRFRYSLRRVIQKGDLLDYAVTLDECRDMAVFRRLEGSLVGYVSPAGLPPSEITLSEHVAAEARRRHGSIDLAAAERDWRSWMNRKGVRPTNPEALFLSFLNSWSQQRQTSEQPPASARSDWIREMAAEWWAGLEDADREFWRAEVGERVELSSGRAGSGRNSQWRTMRSESAGGISAALWKRWRFPRRCWPGPRRRRAAGRSRRNRGRLAALDLQPAGLDAGQLDVLVCGLCPEYVGRQG